MRNYFLTIFGIIRVSARITGKWPYCLVILTGLAARLSLLICFVAVIKIVVWALRSDTAVVSVPFVDLTLSIAAILEVSIFAIPVMFAFAGSTLFISEIVSRRAYERIVREARYRHIRRYAAELMQKTGDARREDIKNFVMRAEPDFARAVGDLARGSLELLQTSIIGITVSAVLAIQNPIIFLGAMVMVVLLVPGYVRRNYLHFVEFKKQSMHLREIRTIENEDLETHQNTHSSDEDTVRQELERVIAGEAAQLQMQLEKTRALGPRMTFPFIYGSLGIVMSCMLWSVMSDGLPIDSSLVGKFVISAVLLRFFVGETNVSLNAIRLINSEYIASRKILDLFKQPVPVEV